MTKNNSLGFSPIEALIIVAILAIIGLVGYRVLNHNKPKDTPATSSQSKQESVKAISTKEDLSKATSDLKKIDTTTTKEENSLKQLTQ
jgi:predicted negative regulator of RcsB-dependent stress response